MRNTLTLIRNKLGQGNIRKFIEKDLGMKYRTFVYQCDNGLVHYKTIKALIEKLDIKFEDFKDYEFIDNKEVHSLSERKIINQEKKIKQDIAELNIPQPMKLSELLGKR